MKKNLILPALIGNTLEYYDFTLFAVFSLQISQTFFPKQDEFLNLLLSLAIFSVGFLMRPLGAIIFGQMGDKSGRKKALIFSISFMAIPTFAIGILPGYDSIGIAAPLLLILCRLIQGVSIGGEGAGAAVFILEHHQLDCAKTTTSCQQLPRIPKPPKLGYLGGLITASNFFGAFLAMNIGILSVHFDLNPYAWRIAFILGGILGLVGFYLRMKTLETPAFKKVVEEQKIAKRPLFKVITKNKTGLLLSLSLGALAGAFAYTILAFLPLYFRNILELDPTHALRFGILGLGSFIVFLPFFGKWSDTQGYVRSTLRACLAVILFVVPLFMIMSSSETFFCILSVIVFGGLCAWITAPAYPIMLSLFPAEQRMSGIAFGFNLGLALFGGTAPMISAFLSKSTGLVYAPSFYLIFVALLFCGCYAVCRYRKNKLITWEVSPNRG